MTDHQQALERVHDQIIENLGSDDPVEQEKLEGIADIGMKVAGFLQSEVADEESWVDTGCGFGQYDCHVRVAGREYDVAIRAGSTEAEMKAWEEALGKGEDDVAKLERRVLEALRVAGHYQLATEFEALVSVSNIGGAASADTHRNGQDAEERLGS